MKDIKREKNCMYLYGIDPHEFRNMLYLEALEYKIRRTEIVLKELLDVHFMTRDNARISDVLSAASFNEKLIKEAKE